MPKPRGTTGPTTEAGKQIASRNAAKHNCTSKSLIVPGENQSEFDALLESLIAEYRPETDMQQIRVNEAARATWELQRAHREFDKSQVRLYSEQPNMWDWTPKQQAEEVRMSRYRTRAERSYHRALQSVECLRTMRLRAEQRAYWENLQDAKLDLSERRLQLTADRFEQTATPQTPKQAAQPKRVKPMPQEPQEQQPEQTAPTPKHKTAPRAAWPDQPSTAAPLPAFAIVGHRTPAQFLAYASHLQEQQIANRAKQIPPTQVVQSNAGNPNV
jgi:hypothetical protein